jgi:pimeloyl-ACP methyl ester carboxylesterase
MKKIQVNDCQVNVKIQGAGEAMLFLHGVPDSSDVWTPAIEHFSAQYQCIAPDLPGFGETQAPKNFDYRLDNLARFVDSLLQSLSINEPVHLVVHDVGGIVGLAFAVRHPEKLKSLTIMDTVFFSDYKWHAMAKTWRKPWVGALTMHLMRHKQFSDAMKKAAPSLSAQQIKNNYKHLTFANRQLILKLYRTLDPEIFNGWQEQLSRVTQQVPTQVIWGNKDTFLPVSLANRFATTKVHIIEPSGHWPMLEHPQRVHELIERHIQTGISPKAGNEG